MKLRFLPGDRAKRDTSGAIGGFAEFRAHRTQAFVLSPCIVQDADICIIAVTLVMDHGVISTSGCGKRHGGAQSGFKPGVAAGAGNPIDSDTLLAYSSRNSGGWPA